MADGEIQVVHCINRCVRRAYLCGHDPLTGADYEHRRELIRHRMEYLAGIMGIEVLGYSVMSNHFHCILRSRHDVVATCRMMKWLRSGGCCVRLGRRGTAVRRSPRSLNSTQFAMTRRGSERSEFGCRVFPGLCGSCQSELQKSRINKISVPGVFGKDASKVKFFLMTLRFWRVCSMWI